MTFEIERRYALAREVAVEAGNLAVKMRQEWKGHFVSAKSHQDFVTAADLAVEDLIRSRISEHFPNDAILGEEQGISGVSDSIWVVDPIDGTTNFMHGMNEWAVSIGYCLERRIELGVIYAPDISVLAEARAGCGAKSNGTPLRVSACSDPNRALVLLGRSERTSTGGYLHCVRRLLEHGMEYRRNGSAAFSLLAVASGNADAFYEAHINPWDATAGILILSEAGGKVTCPSYTEFMDRGGAILTSNSILHEYLFTLLNAI